MSDVTFAAKHPRARKEHICSQCGRIIGEGEVYRRQASIIDDRAHTILCCTQCESFAEALWDAGIDSDGDGWAWLPDLDAGEVAYVGLSREHRMFRDQWRDSAGELTTYPEAA